PLYRGPALGRADPEGAGQGPQAGDPQRRRAEPDQPATRLPFSRALRLCDDALPQRGAGFARSQTGSLGRLPLARWRRQISARDADQRLTRVGRAGSLGSGPAGRKTVSAIRLPRSKTLIGQFEREVNSTAFQVSVFY